MIKFNWTDFDEQKVVVIIVKYENDHQLEEIIGAMQYRIKELKEEKDKKKD